MNIKASKNEEREEAEQSRTGNARRKTIGETTKTTPDAYKENCKWVSFLSTWSTLYFILQLSSHKWPNKMRMQTMMKLQLRNGQVHAQADVCTAVPERGLARL